MPWGAPVEYDPFAPDAPDAAMAMPGIAVQTPDAGGVPPVTAAPPAPQSTWQGIKSAFTGEGRSDWPDSPEFMDAYANMPRGPNGELPDVGGLPAVMQSAVTPDENAQWDILSKAIPGLERATDSHGNLMLKAPGMKDFAYLNKPGLTKRDLDEFGTQTLATLPFMGLASKGVTTLGRAAYGAAGLAAGSVEQDALATAAGSDQGISPERAGVSAAVGAGLPIAGQAAKFGLGYAGGTVNAFRNLAQSTVDPKAVGERVVRDAFRRDAASGGLADPKRAVQPGDELSAAKFGQDLRVGDYGGEEVMSEARKAANLSPSARDDMMRVIGGRFESQGARAQSVIGGEMKLGNSSQAVRTQLQEQARLARAPYYTQAYTLGRNGVSSPTLEAMQKAPIFQRAMGAAERRVQDQAATPGWNSTGVRGPSGKYTLEFWDQVKQVLDDYGGQALRSGQKGRGAQLVGMARSLRNELDSMGQMGKFYSQARGVAMRFFDAEDALDAGMKFAKGGHFNWDDAAHMISQLTAPEKKLFQEGFGDVFMQKVQGVGDRTNLLNQIAASPMEQRRLEVGLGKQNYQMLDSFLRIEGIMQKWKHAMGNSTTAQQLTDLAKTYAPQGLGGGALGYYGSSGDDPEAAILGFLMAGKRAAQLAVDARVAKHVAEALTSRNPDIFQKGLQQIGKSPFREAILAGEDVYRKLLQAPAAQAGINQTQE